MVFGDARRGGGCIIIRSGASSYIKRKLFSSWSESSFELVDMILAALLSGVAEEITRLKKIDFRRGRI